MPHNNFHQWGAFIVKFLKAQIIACICTHTGKVMTYLGLQCVVFFCGIFHMLESSQIVIANGRRLQENTTVKCKELKKVCVKEG